MTRVIAGTAADAASPYRPAPVPAPPPTVRGRASSPPGKRCSAPSTASASRICTPDRAPSASALSRGAVHALLVEADQKAVRTVRENVRTLGLPGAEVRTGRAEQIVTGPAPSHPYDVVFLDPPYAVTDDDLREILLTLRAQGGSRTMRSSPWNAAPGRRIRLARRIRATAGPSLRRGTLWYGRAAATCEDAR